MIGNNYIKRDFTRIETILKVNYEVLQEQCFVIGLKFFLMNDK